MVCLLDVLWDLGGLLKRWCVGGYKFENYAPPREYAKVISMPSVSMASTLGN